MIVRLTANVNYTWLLTTGNFNTIIYKNFENLTKNNKIMGDYVKKYKNSQKTCEYLVRAPI